MASPILSCIPFQDRDIGDIVIGLSLYILLKNVFFFKNNFFKEKIIIYYLNVTFNTQLGSLAYMHACFVVAMPLNKSNVIAKLLPLHAPVNGTTAYTELMDNERYGVSKLTA